MRDLLYVFLHVPKTGGTTIIRHLRTHLAWDREFVHLGTWGNNFREQHDRIPFEERPPEQRNLTRVLAGHQARFGIHRLVDRDPRYFTVLREPADRIVSAYNFRMTQDHADISFDEWYADYPRNNSFKWLRVAFNLVGADAFPETREMMRKELWFVGLTERLNDDLPFLFRALGTPPEWIDQRVATTDSEDLAGMESGDEEVPLSHASHTVHKRLEMTDALRDRLHEDNARDLKLYEIGRRLHERRVERIRNAAEDWDREG